VKKPTSKGPVNVFAGGNLAGVIERSSSGDDMFSYSYAENAAPDCAVSLTMDVGPDRFDSMSGLLPIFEMNLPEGMLKERLRKDFAKTIPHFDDLDLLAIVGESQIGRLRYSQQRKLAGSVPTQSVQELLTYRGAADLFEDLLRRFARYSGISGVQPKVLVRDDERLPPRVTQAGATHIVKSFDPREFPELAANELLSTQGARAAGIDTPGMALSQNRNILAVERFDLLPDGRYLGIEDFCVLDARRSHGRYDGSYERVAQRIAQFVSAEQRVRALDQYAAMVAYCCAIENGDAHLKNFSVIYESPIGAVRFAPAYDLVCTTVYSARDTLALTLNGTKQFPERAALVKFIRGITAYRPARVAELLDRVAQGVRVAIDAALAMAREQKALRPFVESYTASLNRGMKRSLRRD
jgi:serine/threonine-protein kinase HipA